MNRGQTATKELAKISGQMPTHGLFKVRQLTTLTSHVSSHNLLRQSFLNDFTHCQATPKKSAHWQKVLTFIFAI